MRSLTARGGRQNAVYIVGARNNLHLDINARIGRLKLGDEFFGQRIGGRVAVLPKSEYDGILRQTWSADADQQN